jgi:hypothetical protein
MKITAKILALALSAAVGSAHAALVLTVPLTTSAEAGANSFADPLRGPPTTGPGPFVGDPSRCRSARRRSR